MRLDKWLLAHFAGLSPLTARELSFRFAGETDAPIPTLDAARLAAFLTAEFAALPPVQMQPMLLWKDGAPTDFTVTVRNVRIAAGAGFVIVLTGDIMTMPGLPKIPAAEKIDVDENGRITGLF